MIQLRRIYENSYTSRDKILGISNTINGAFKNIPNKKTNFESLQIPQRRGTQLEYQCEKAPFGFIYCSNQF